MTFAKPVRPAGLILAFVLLMAACGGESGPDSHAAVFGADVVLIKELWGGFSDSWSGGLEAGYGFVADHNHPILECEKADFETYRLRLPDPFRWELVLRDTSIERDEGWFVQDAAGVGVVPAGRIYLHKGTSVYRGDFPTETRENESHSAILDGEAVFFFPCRD